MKTFISIDPKDELPPKLEGSVWSASYFVQTENGKQLARYDYENELWRVHHIDNYLEVVFWLKELIII